MQVKFNGQWHEVVVLVVIDADKSRTITTDEIEDMRTDKEVISYNELHDSCAAFGLALGKISATLSLLDEDVNRLDKKYNNDTTEN
jgi:hypothetical protein